MVICWDRVAPGVPTLTVFGFFLAYSKNSADPQQYDVKADVKAGDKLVFLVNMNGDYNYDFTKFDPTITYSDGEAHTASKEYGKSQGQDG
jgi:hypothetical protein